MAFKTFAPGVLTSSDVNTFLMRQAVITCTSSTRPASPSEGMTIYETDTNLYKFYDGTAWRGVGEYVSYTPTLTNMTLGNGTVSANYTRIGALVHTKGIITAGSTTSLGSSATDTIVVSFPVAQTGGNLQVTNMCEIRDDSTGIIYTGIAKLTSGIQLNRINVLGGVSYIAAERLQSGTFTVQTGDQFRWSVTYQGVLT